MPLIHVCFGKAMKPNEIAKQLLLNHTCENCQVRYVYCKGSCKGSCENNTCLLWQEKSNDIDVVKMYKEVQKRIKALDKTIKFLKGQQKR
jgi:hypothetical protein